MHGELSPGLGLGGERERLGLFGVGGGGRGRRGQRCRGRGGRVQHAAVGRGRAGTRLLCRQVRHTRLLALGGQGACRDTYSVRDGALEPSRSRGEGVVLTVHVVALLLRQLLALSLLFLALEKMISGPSVAFGHRGGCCVPRSVCRDLALPPASQTLTLEHRQPPPTSQSPGRGQEPHVRSCPVLTRLGRAVSAAAAPSVPARSTWPVPPVTASATVGGEHTGDPRATLGTPKPGYNTPRSTLETPEPG